MSGKQAPSAAEAKARTWEFCLIEGENKIHITSDGVETLCEVAVETIDWPRAGAKTKITVCDMCKAVLELDYEKAHVTMTPNEVTESYST